MEEAFRLLGEGDIEGHNALIASAIRETTAKEPIRTVFLAQLSMSLFVLSFPDAEAMFGVPVLTSGETGMQRVAEVLRRTGPAEMRDKSSRVATVRGSA